MTLAGSSAELELGGHARACKSGVIGGSSPNICVKRRLIVKNNSAHTSILPGKHPLHNCLSDFFFPDEILVREYQDQLMKRCFR